MQNQGILATLFTTSRTVFYTYFTGIFMLNGKQLLNKTDTQNLSQNCLFTVRMSFYKCLNEYGGSFHDHDTRLAWTEK